MILNICEACGYWSDSSLSKMFTEAFKGFPGFDPPTGSACPHGCGMMRLVQPNDKLCVIEKRLTDSVGTVSVTLGMSELADAEWLINQLMEVAEAVATNPDVIAATGPCDDKYCVFCNGDEDYSGQTDFLHEQGCIVLKARKLVKEVSGD